MKPGRILPIIAVLMLGVSVSAQAATIQLSMENLEIMPAEASAKVGDTIEWINKDVFAHTATARNGDFDVMLPPKKTGTLVVTTAGTFEVAP
jgi:plastocyanin